MKFPIWIQELRHGEWLHPPENTAGAGGWFPGKPFSGLSTAIFCAREYHARTNGLVRVVNEETRKILWESPRATDKEEDEAMDGVPDITEPIKLDRGKLIERLQEIHDEEKKTREEAQAKEDAARKDVEKFLGDNLDRVAEYMRARLGGSWNDVLEGLTENEFRDDNYKPKDKQPTRRESDSEKFVRVLGMTNDETVSIEPHQPLYDLL